MLLMTKQKTLSIFVEIRPCHWENSLPSINPEHGHILTGDLRNVCNNKLRKLIT